MTVIPDGRVCILLGEALALLDGAGESLAATYVNQAMETLNCPMPLVVVRPAVPSR